MSEAPLPLWRLISGFAVLGSLLLIALALAPVYVASYQLSQYVRTLASRPGMVAVPDETLRAQIVERAHVLKLPVEPTDVTVTHTGNRMQLQIARYKVQVWHADLHFPGVSAGGTAGP